eukprot:161076-Amphidinium_carterae.1
MLTELLTYKFPGNCEHALDAFEKMLQKYHAVSDQEISDGVRVGLAMAHLGDERVRNHLQLNASRIGSWQELRKEVREIAMATQMWGGSVPMEIDGVIPK